MIYKVDFEGIFFTFDNFFEAARFAQAAIESGEKDIYALNPIPLRQVTITIIKPENPAGGNQ